jgi:hypothetical protein
MTFIDVFHNVAQLRREHVFPDDRLLPITHQEDARTAATGWIGRDYQPGGIVLLGVNPGGGGDGYRGNPTDAELYRQLREFRDAPPARRGVAFAELCSSWVAIQRTHSIWRVIAATLDAAGATVDEVAFLNMLPFRTREDKPAPVAVMTAAWDRATRPQLEALSPKAMVALGFKAANALARLSDPGSMYRIFRVKRARGDTRVTDEAQAALAELREWIDSRG